MLVGETLRKLTRNINKGQEFLLINVVAQEQKKHRP
jgi:hypothetical protein